MTRVRSFPAAVCLLALSTACSAPPPAAPAAPFSVVEASFADMQAAMAEGRVTSRQLVEQYLQRIALYEERLNAAIAVNPKALDEADRLDAERRAGQVRGPMHGIPIALKDNIHTTDMPTTGGAARPTHEILEQPAPDEHVETEAEEQARVFARLKEMSGGKDKGEDDEDR